MKSVTNITTTKVPGKVDWWVGYGYGAQEKGQRTCDLIALVHLWKMYACMSIL